MAKKATGKKKAGGPYLAAAFFCERVIEDKSDGALTVVRMIDTITITLPADSEPDVPSKSKRIPVGLTAVLSFKSGDAPGHHTLRYVLVSPSGKESPPTDQVVTFTEKEQGGANYILKSVVQVMKGGLFWLEVSLDGRLVTRMPIQISVNREAPPEKPSADQAPSHT